MSDRQLVPSIEHRLSAVIEMNRRRHERGDPFRQMPPVVTLSREFGCEAFPVAEQLKALLEEKTRRPWLLLEKALLEELAKRRDLEPSGFERIGDRSRFFDNLVSVLSPHWHSDHDYFRVLSAQIAHMAEQGDVLFVGRGASVLLQDRKNTYHFRLVAPWEFKVGSIQRRLGLGEEETGALVRRRQEQRDAFIRNFLNRDVNDPYLYQALFNNAKNTVEQMATAIASYVPVR